MIIANATGAQLLKLPMAKSNGLRALQLPRPPGAAPSEAHSYRSFRAWGSVIEAEKASITYDAFLSGIGR